jgi:hypothetical protein
MKKNEMEKVFAALIPDHENLESIVNELIYQFPRHEETLRKEYKDLMGFELPQEWNEKEELQ